MLKQPVKLAVDAPHIFLHRAHFGLDGSNPLNKFTVTSGCIFQMGDAGVDSGCPPNSARRLNEYRCHQCEWNPTINTDGFPPWTQAEIQQFRKHYPLGTKPRLAFELVFYTGLRRSDLVRLGRQFVRNGVIEIETVKSVSAKKPVVAYIQIVEPLQEAIDAGPAGDMIYLLTEYGKPFKKDGFGNWFRSKCDAAGISKSSHGLRKNAAQRLAEDGASEHQLMAIMGWTDIKTAMIYTRDANRRRMAIMASKGLANEQS